MGLIKAAIGSFGGTIADQFKEYFYCDSLSADVLVAKGVKRTSKRSGNNGSDNIINSGAVIAVADGQCMMIVEQGRVIELSAEPGEYTYDASTEPSIFNGQLKPGVKEMWETMKKRFTFGGEPPKDQRIYYFNTKEIIGNKYGTPNAVPFRVVDERAGIDIDIGVRCFGEYSYRITNPILFYSNVCGNVSDEYRRDAMDSQLKSELLTALQPAFAKISALGIRYSMLPGHTTEIKEALREELTEDWTDTRGIEIEQFGVSSVTADEDDENMIKELQRNAAFMNPTRAAAHLVGAQASAMQAAAENENAGSAMAFMGMNMANQAGGTSAQSLFQMGQQTAAQATPVKNTWKCTCGTENTGKFCSECGQPKPVSKTEWTCSCGTVNTGKFCSECGQPKPEDTTWKCTCGAENTGKFCSECGAKKPE